MGITYQSTISSMSEGPIANEHPINDDVTAEVAALMRAPRMCQVRELPTSGTTISYSETGDDQGVPVVMFTGMGENRMYGLFLEDSLRKLGLRLICVDRPGRGKTTPVAPKDLNVLKFTDCVVELLDLLGIERFGVMGHSCGCLFAAGLAVRAPQRLRGRLVLLAPWNLVSCPAVSWKMKMLHHLPGGLVRHASAIIPHMLGRSAEAGFKDSFGRRFTQEMSEVERACISTPRGAEIQKQSMILTMDEGGKKAMVSDMLLCLEALRPSAVHYEDVTRVPMVVYHGDKDTVVPPACASWMKLRVPRCEVVIKPGATHSILLDLDFMADVVLPSFSAAD